MPSDWHGASCQICENKFLMAKATKIFIKLYFLIWHKTASFGVWFFLIWDFKTSRDLIKNWQLGNQQKDLNMNNLWLNWLVLDSEAPNIFFYLFPIVIKFSVSQLLVMHISYFFVRIIRFLQNIQFLTVFGKKRGTIDGWYFWS
jgi:hypothetical protein